MALKKQWYEIVAPKMFGEPVIGETLAVEPKHLLGRTIEVSLLEVIKDFSKFYIKLNLRIDRIEGQKAYTKIIGHDTMTERIYRMVQRHGRRVDVVNDVTTKDGVRVRVKTVFVLLKRVGSSMKDATRAAAKVKVQELVEKLTFEELITNVIKGSLQVEIRKVCNKVYPIAGIEIRRTQLLGEKRIV